MNTNDSIDLLLDLSVCLEFSASGVILENPRVLVHLHVLAGLLDALLALHDLALVTGFALDPAGSHVSWFSWLVSVVTVVSGRLIIVTLGTVAGLTLDVIVL